MQTSAKRWSLGHIGLLALIVAVIFAMTAIPGNAQATSGTILGTLTDTSGAVIGNTNVQLINEATNTKTVAKTNDSGYYQFVDVVPGTYKIIVQKEGFKQLSRAGIVLQTEARIQVDLSLSVGASTETVEVTASSPLIEADNVSLGTVVDERETNELPLNGRNVMNLTQLVPSVIPLGETSGSPTGQNPFGWGNYQIGGGMAGWSSTYMDGAPDNGIYFNNVEIIPSQDSIGEFKVETNDMSADYGRTGGGVINFVTKSGTKDIHGGAWEFIRNKIFNANPFFSNGYSQPGGVPLPRPPFTQNQYGANFGGPVVIPHLFDGRKNTFFFVNWEGFGLRQGETITTTIPDQSAFNNYNLAEWGQTNYDPLTTCPTQGGCLVGTTIPGYANSTGKNTYPYSVNQGDRLPINWETGITGEVGGVKGGTATPANTSQFQTTTPGMSNYINPTALLYMQKMWPEAATTSAQLSNYTANASSGGNNYQFVTRLDHDISDKQHLMGRYSWWDNINLAADPLKNGVCAEGECTERYRMHNFVLDDTYTMSSKMVLDTRISYGRYGYVREPLVPWTAADLASIGWPSSYSSLVEFPGPPIFVVPSWDAYNLFSGQGADSTIIDYQDTYRIAGNITRFVGNHTLKFGAEYTVDRFNYAQTNTSSGLWNFNGSGTRNSSIGAHQDSTTGLDAASYFTGYIDNGGSSWYDDLTASAIHYPGVYALDDWRVTHRLTLHLGVRWERVGPFTERHDRVTDFSPTASNDALTAQGVTGVPGNIELANTPEQTSRFGVQPDELQFSPHVGLSFRLGPNTVINTGYGLFWLPNYLTTSGNTGWDASTGFSTPYVASTNGWYPTNSMSTPYPLSTPGNPASAYIIYPPGHNLALFQNEELGNAPNGDLYHGNFGYTTQWNFGVQQQLGKSTAIDVSYAGSTGVHLPISNGGFPLDRLPDADLVTYGTNCTPSPTQNCLSSTVPNPYYTPISTVNPSASLAVPTVGLAQAQLIPYPEYSGVSTSDPWGQSNYEALEVKLTKRFSQGASVNVAYSFDKLESDTDAISSWLEGGITGVADYNNMKGEKSLSSTDAAQRLVVAYVYDIPVGRGKGLLPNINRAADEVIGGWGLQGITTLMKGFPIGIGERINAVDSFGNGASRPNVVPGCNKIIGGSATSKLHGWYNAACFTESAPYTWGDESRNDSAITGPGVANWDMSIVKKFPITSDGRVNFQFRAEFYNLFNRVQFGPPNNQFDATSEVGWTQSQVNGPRVAQFALRIQY